MQPVSATSSAATGYLPNFIIIGAQKCGTTALHWYLREHPDICMSSSKEPSFFCNSELWPNFSRGTDWYKSFFTRPAKAIGEASPEYTAYPYLTGIPERMHSLLPEAKLIYLVRDPIERIISQYVHNLYVIKEKRSLQTILQDFENDYVYRSQYFRQISEFLRYYKMDQILVLEQEALMQNRQQTLVEVFKFLGVSSEFDSPEFSKLHHMNADRLGLNKIGRTISSLTPGKELLGKYFPEVKQTARSLFRSAFNRRPPKMPASLRAKLAKHLEPDIRQFRSLTGLKLENWSV
ncbi:MAG TPA: sulfotransferase [Chroococcales cyanobacterium]